MDNKWVVSLSERDLRCKGGCDFYANPQWEGYCSKCWRLHQKKLQQRKAAAVRSPSSAVESGTHTTASNKSWPSFGFDKFLEKKSQQIHRRSSTMKSIIGKRTDNAGEALGGIQVQTMKPRLQRQLSTESIIAKEKFYNFLCKLPKAVASAVAKQCMHVVRKISQESSFISIENLSEMVQDFYQTMAERLNKTYGITDKSPAVDDILAEIETFICIRCYLYLFCSSTDEEGSDLSMHDRIRTLQWVAGGFLDPGLDLDKPSVRELFDKTVSEIIDMNSCRSPGSKLQCLVTCCKLIFEAFEESHGVPASADEFLPALIYVLLKSNPPLIQSNINFITRFSLPCRTMSGEAGYYFTNLCCALNFIQNLNASSLKMLPEEFQAYSCGELLPPVNETTGRCRQALRSLEDSLEQLKFLRTKTDAALSKVEQLNLYLDREWKLCHDRIDTFLTSLPSAKRSVSDSNLIIETNDEYMGNSEPVPDETGHPDLDNSILVKQEAVMIYGGNVSTDNNGAQTADNESTEVIHIANATDEEHDSPREELVSADVDQPMRNDESQEILVPSTKNNDNS